MSFQFGQFRRSQLDSFLTPLTYTTENVKINSVISTAVTFVDTVVELNGNSILKPTESDGLRAKNYYIRFKVYKKKNPQTIIVKAINTEKQTDNSQSVSTIEVAAGKETDYSMYEIVISPNNTYNQIKFDLQRELEDYNTKNADGTYGRICKIEIVRFDEIYNVVNYLNSFTNKTSLLQIGVQSAPGLLMCINGEEIRVGRSGIYEILNGYKISFIGFIVEPDDKQYFMLDYQY
jgi:hypothetical protein